MIRKSAAFALAGALALSLAGCGSAASSTAASSSTAESAASPETSTSASTLETAAAAFTRSDALDENGFFKGVKAVDYVTLPENYLSMSIPAAEVAVTDADVEADINSTLAQYATDQAVTDRAAESGDTVNIDYVGTVDGVAFTGGDTKGAGNDLTLGSGQLIDDFEDQIVGHNIGDSFDVTVTFPEGYSDSTDAAGNAVVLSGKEAVFAVTLNSISASVTPELTDEFVTTNMDASYGSTAAEYRESVRLELEDIRKENYLLTELLNTSTFAEPLPEDMYTYYSYYLLETPMRYATTYGMSLDEMVGYLTGSAYATAQDFLNDNREALAEQVKISLIYQAIAEQNNITCTDEDVTTHFVESEHRSDFVDSRSDYEAAFGAPYLKMLATNGKGKVLLMENATVA